MGQLFAASALEAWKALDTYFPNASSSANGQKSFVLSQDFGRNKSYSILFSEKKSLGEPFRSESCPAQGDHTEV